MGTVDVIIPVKDEYDNLQQTFALLSPSSRYINSVYVVCDGEAEKKDLQRRFADLKIGRQMQILVSELGGFLNAIKIGLQYADAEYTAIMMGDHTDPSHVFAQMCELATMKSLDVVVASRFMPGGSVKKAPFIKNKIARSVGWVLKKLKGFPTQDPTNNFKIYRTRFLKTQTIESKKGFEFALEMTVKAFLQKKVVIEIPTHWSDRRHGTTKFSLLPQLPYYFKWFWLAMKQAPASKKL